MKTCCVVFCCIQGIGFGYQYAIAGACRSRAAYHLGLGQECHQQGCHPPAINRLFRSTQTGAAQAI